MLHNSYVCTLYIYVYMTINIYIYTHMCMCVCMFMYCHVWLPSSLCPASFQHPYSILVFPASFQLPYSILTVSSQHHPSLKHQYVLIHMCSDHQCVLVHVCIGNHSWLICMYIIYICVHPPSIFSDNMYALVINLYDWFVTHMYSVLVCVLVTQKSCWCSVR